MKKFIGITLAAVCALSVAAVSFSACGEKDSDEVTAEEWASAMVASNALNVTLNATVSSTYTITLDGTTTTRTSTGDIVAKTALSMSGTTVTGNTYLYTVLNSAYGEESETETVTQYETFAESAYSYVSKTEYTEVEKNSETDALETNSEVDWYGKLYDTSATPYDSEAFETIEELLTTVAGIYDEFEYVDGVYRYIDSEDPDNVAYVKINDGKLTSLVVESSTTYTYSGYSYTSLLNYDIKFSDYGSTSVSIPSEYTYEYYYLNYAP